MGKRLFTIAALTLSALAQPVPPIGPPVPAVLVQYLELTGTQAAAMSANAREMQQAQVAANVRQSQVLAELAVEHRREAVDPLALGQRYVELESLRRQMNDAVATRNQKNRALLTDPQRPKLAALVTTRGLLPLIGEAQCANLVDRGAVALDPTFAGLLTTSVIDRFVTTTGFVCAGPGFPTALRLFLELTDAQVVRIVTENDAVTRAYRGQQLRIAQVRAEIEEETTKPAPDAAAVGVRYAEIEHINRSLEQVTADASRRARAVLTPAQGAKLATLLEGQRLSPAIAAAECEGLIDSATPQGSSFAGIRPVAFGCGGGTNFTFQP